MTPAEIEPATFRFVAQHLNHCATAVSNKCIVYVKVAVIRRALFGGKYVTVFKLARVYSVRNVETINSSTQTPV